MDNDDFAAYMNTKKLCKWNTGVYSYFYIVKFAGDPRPETRSKLEYFELTNPHMHT
jgi:hypothetical protein